MHVAFKPCAKIISNKSRHKEPVGLASSGLPRSRSTLPPQRERIQAAGLAGLSVPTDSFRTNYPNLNTDHCDSLRNLRLSQEVLDIVPTDMVFDPYGTGPHTGLDTANFAQLNTVLAGLWSQSAFLARRRLFRLPTAFRQHSAANQLAEQCAIFCASVQKLYSRDDMYVINFICHQVIAAKLTQLLDALWLCIVTLQV